MSDDVKPDLELDLKGLLCPLPMVKVSQNINSVPVGGVIRAVATDPGAMADIPAWRSRPATKSCPPTRKAPSSSSSSSE